jgi:CRP/FNR family transcriptional regulator, cyclic AMP receptor protein
MNSQIATNTARAAGRSYNRQIYTLTEHVLHLLQLEPQSLNVLKPPYERPIPEGIIRMTEPAQTKFDVDSFLSTAGPGRRIIQFKPKEVFFSQGNPADSVFYLQKGRAKLTVVSTAGKEATITLLSAEEFIGEESIAAMVGLRMATATAITACTALKIDRKEMARVMHEEHSLSDRFMAFLLHRSMRIQADLVDQLFNSSEKRLARILLLMAEFGQPGEPETLIPPITQETLADMIGTTRSRVSFFMNRFRKLGFIEYNGRIRVHKSLLNVVLYDQSSLQNAVSATLLGDLGDRTDSNSNPTPSTTRKAAKMSKTRQNES